MNSQEKKKARNLIIQVGRLDRSYRDELLFSINHQEGKEISGKAELSSLFIKNHFLNPDETELLLIFPVSLVFQDLTDFGDDVFVNKLKQISHAKEIFENPYEIYRHHPHAEGNNFVVVSSLGSFKFKEENIRLDADLNYISAQIYLYLINHFDYEELEKVYIDISSGHNIYVTAMINAINRFIPYMAFKRIHLSRDKALKAEVVNTDPIYRGIPKVSISFSEFRAKAFNTYFYDNVSRNQIDSLLRKFREDKELFEWLEKLIYEQYILAHACTNMGIAPGFTLLDRNIPVKLPEEYYNITGRLARIFPVYEADPDPRRRNKNLFFTVVNFTFILAFTSSVFALLQNLGLLTEEIIFQEKRKKSNQNGKEIIDKFESKAFDDYFKKLEENLQMTQPPYAMEVNNTILKFINLALEEPSIAHTLSEYQSISELEEKITERKINRSFDSRNFFAHLGMEKNITQIKFIDGKLYIRYDKKMIQENNILDQIIRKAFRS